MAAAVENYPVPPCRPPLFNATPVEIEEDAARLVRNSSLLVDQLKRPDDDYKFSNTILQFIDAENLRLRDMRVIQFYRSTSTDSKLREASRKASKQLTDAESELFNRVDLHRAFSIVRSRNDLLDPEYQHYLLKIGESFEENGLSISDPERRQRFRDITTKLNALRSEGLKNLDTDATGIWLSQEELDGVPPNYFENRKTNSEVSASDENQSDLKFWVSAKDPDTLPVLKFAKNSETRKKTLIMRQQRAPGNVSVYREIITHRDEAARLLGFQNHAAFRTSSRIIQTPEAVQKLLNDLQTRFRFKRQEEVETLLAVKRQHASGESDNLYLWDKAFYSRIYQESTLSYNQESVMEYFSLEHCVLKMFDTFEHMFSIRIKPFKPRPEETWHETVTLYALWEGDESKSLFLGWLYVDPYPREGKYQHFGYYPLQPARISKRFASETNYNRVASCLQERDFIRLPQWS